MAAATAPAYAKENSGYGGYDPDYGRPRYARVTPLVRAFPNEDIFFWRKRIDNSRVLRQGDPRIWDTCWRFISALSLVVILVVGLLVPNAAHLIAGIQLQQLDQQVTALSEELRGLEAEEAQLSSPRRLRELMQKMELESPQPGWLQDLQPNGEEEALLRTLLPEKQVR